MKVISSNKRKIAWVMLLISCVNILRPTASFALTSGPTQPETEGFKAVGVSDMVDLQTGDFKYNIPLFDIDGYPVNLSYQSGAGIDDEASWVGLGWSLNTGSINRQVRGIADDMEGDAVTVDHMTKPNVTIGGRITGKVETLGAGKKIGGSGSLSTGIFVNNYTGIGAEQSVNAGISLSLANKGTLTAGLGGGISSNTQRGVDASPYMSLSLYDKSQDKSQVSAGLSASLGYNSRSGMKNFGLGASFSAEQYQSKTVVTKDAGGNDVSKTESTANLLGAGAGLYSISYNTEPINPRIQVPYSISSWSYSIDGGYSFPAVFWGGGLTGYKTVTQVLTPKIVKPAYGFLYAEKGKNNPDAAMDFIRENDNPVIPELPNLAVPVQTPDMYSFTSQEGSGQFRLYRGGTGAFFDSQAQDQSDNTSFGLDAGFGAATAHFGVTLFKQSVHTTTRKWAKDNNYLKVGDFQDQSLTVPAQEHVYFKVAGEKTIQDNALTQKMRGLQPLKVSLNGKQALAGFDGYADAQAAITNLNRQPKTTMISYLTADEAKLTGFDRSINDYLPVDAAGIPAVLNDKPQVKQSYPRVDPFDQTSKSGNTYNVQQQMQVDNQEEPDEYPVHKGHHVSEFTVTDPGGKRMIYGLPVYNVKEDEYTFAIGNSYTATNNIVQLTNSGTADNPVVNVKNKGIDEYSHKESKPPYATSYMLTEILSPDYVDKSGNGISDDDQGTAIKFNYSRLPYLYNWRAPYQGATLNKGLLADPDDDKASIIYGKKEIWYVSSIESKTKVAYFITKDRNDAIGASDDWSQGGQNRNLKQKCLTEIRLYAKSDMTKPIKVVKFQYDYTLCPFVPNYYDPANPTATGGKLTLKKVWFEYQNIDRGKYNPYVFTYNQPTVTAINQPGAYGYLSTDRWGVYKSPGENPDPSLTNEEFPYTNQQKSVVDQNVALWQLKKIGLPTGGNINVSYESDDYAYVQNRHAMSMYTITGLTDGANGADIDWAAPDAVNKMHGIKMLLPNNMEPPTNLTGAPLLAWFKKNYLDGSDYMYTKMSVWMSTDNNPLNGNTNGNYWDFIPSYNFVSGVSYDTNTNIMKIVFQDVKAGSLSRSPVTVSAWQRMKIDYPRYAYNGFYNRPGVDGNTSLSDAIGAIISAVSNFSELFQNFYQKADSKKYAGKANKLKCFARMARYETDANGRIEKAGGGLRVSKIYIDDNWGTINSPGKAVSGLYGQSYDYTTIENGQAISSGVATYEPHVGSDENPFKLPVPYTQQIKGGLNNYFDMEEPFGESVFPAPMVTYAKVTVRDLIKGGTSVVNDAGQRTGYMLNEYYTSRDFPVKVNVLPINTIHNKPSSYFSFIKTMSDDELYMSQGYSIQLNDMNGKLKSTKTYDQSNALIASTEYFYKCDDTGGNEFTLNNNVKVLNQNGSVTNNIIGQEIEMFTDFREQESVNTGTTVNVGVDLINFGPIGLYLPHVPIEANDDYSLFRSACSLKVIQSYGVLDRVVSRVNGSNITTQNIAFDGLTGSPLITKTQNEFNKDIYAVTIPAYWAYPGMGPAYPNQGVMLSGLNADGNGKLNSSFYSYLNSGDEVLDLDPAKQNVSGSDYGQRFWVVEQIRATTPTNTGAYLPGSGNYNVAGATGVTSIKYLMDRWGQIKKSYSSALVKIVRAGSRNMINGEIAKIVCLNNPIGTDNNLQLKNNTDLTTALKVINASAVTYDEIWAAEPPDIHIVENATQNWQLSTVSLTGATFVPSIESYTVKPPSSEDISNWPLQGANWGARLAICGIKPANDAIFAANGSLDIYTTFTAPTTSNPFGFLVGYASTSGLDFDIDCGTYRFSNSVFIPTSYGWLIQPMYITLTPGIHNLHIHLSKGLVTNPALMAAGVEIYNNTMLDMYNSTIGQAPSINPIFSTSSLQNAAKVNESITYGSDSPIYRYNWTDYLSTPNAPCINQANVKAINPYTYGYRGNWRPYQSKVYQQNRVYNSILNQTNNAVDIKNAGYIDAFFSNWYYLATANSGKGLWTQNPNATRWTTASTVTLYDKYGQQLENMDALNRFSTAEFDFNGQLPAAVATNARNREIYSNTFEDAYFVPGGTIYVDANTLPEFTQVSSGQPISKFITNGIAHSGKSSVLLPQDGLTLTTKAYAGSQSKYLYLDYDSSNQYQKNTTLNGLYPNGFEPAPAPGYYLMNVWVKDINIDNKSTIPVTIAVNGAAATDIKIKAVVEDWKLVEAKLDLRAFTNGAQVKIAITPVAGSTPVYVDDLRIHPYDSEMKTFVYDKSSLRLMAQLDENGFATFYEYDSQGQLIRVKKETEKGVVTLKESRSSYIKNTQ